MTKLDWIKNQKSFLRTLFCPFCSDPDNATMSLAPLVLSLSWWSNEIQIMQSPLQSFSLKLIWLLCHLEASTLWCADILQHPAPLGAAKETLDSPISISTGDAISSWNIKNLKHASAIIHTAPRQGDQRFDRLCSSRGHVVLGVPMYHYCTSINYPKAPSGAWGVLRNGTSKHKPPTSLRPHETPWGITIGISFKIPWSIW